MADIQLDPKFCEKYLKMMLNNWNIDPNPKWRLYRNYKPLPSIEQMVNDICEFKNWFKSIAVNIFNQDTIEKLMKIFIVYFVQSMSHGENLGCKNFSDTKTVSESFFVNSPNYEQNLLCEKQIEKIETLNMFKACRLASKIRCTENDKHWPQKKTCEEELKYILKHYLNVNGNVSYHPALSGESLLNMHKVLTANCLDAKKSGVLRDCPVIAGIIPQFAHHYPSPEVVSTCYWMILDYYNSAAVALKHFFVEEHSMNEHHFVQETIKLSAWLLYHFVSLHPFTDGNGRMARMVCAYALSAIVPFPVGIYNIFAPTNYEDYVNALKETRKPYLRLPFEQQVRECKPEAVAAMVLESCWFACQNFQKGN